MPGDASPCILQSKDESSNLPESQLVEQVRFLQERVANLETQLAEAGRDREAIRETENRYQRLLESVTTYTYSVTLNNGAPVSTTHGSGCLATTGFAPEDYAANPNLWIAMVHPDDREMVQRHVAELLAGKYVAPVEHRIRTKDGDLRWVRSTVILHHDGSGLLHCYEGLIEDITEPMHAKPDADASSFTHRCQFVAPYVRVKARRSGKPKANVLVV